VAQPGTRLRSGDRMPLRPAGHPSGRAANCLGCLYLAGLSDSRNRWSGPTSVRVDRGEALRRNGPDPSARLPRSWDGRGPPQAQRTQAVQKGREVPIDEIPLQRAPPDSSRPSIGLGVAVRWEASNPRATSRSGRTIGSARDPCSSRRPCASTTVQNPDNVQVLDRLPNVMRCVGAESYSETPHSLRRW